MLVFDTALGRIVATDESALALITESEEEHGETEEHAEEEETVNPVLPTGSDMVYALIFFGALWAAMKFVLLPPIQRARAERAAKITAAKDAAANASSDMGTAQADYDAALADARAEAASIIDTARAEADAHRSQVMAAAEADAAEVRAVAAADIAAARTRAIGALTDDVAGIAAGAASTVVGRQLDAASARPIVERALSGGGA